MRDAGLRLPPKRVLGTLADKFLLERQHLLQDYVDRLLQVHFHPEVELRANLQSISHRCHPVLVAFVRKLTQETMNLPLGGLQGGFIGKRFSWNASTFSRTTSTASSRF